MAALTFTDLSFSHSCTHDSSHSLHTMNSSHDTDVSAQTNQLRSATFQRSSTRSYQNPTWAPSNFVPSPVVRDSSPSPAHWQLQGTSRPHTIGELAERVKQILGENPRPIKAWLRIAENARRDAKSFQEQGDLESAFVEYAKAATCVLEKIPADPDYRVVLSTRQRHNIGLVSYFWLILRIG